MTDLRGAMLPLPGEHAAVGEVVKDPRRLQTLTRHRMLALRGKHGTQRR